MFSTLSQKSNPFLNDDEDEDDINTINATTVAKNVENIETFKETGAVASFKTPVAEDPSRSKRLGLDTWQQSNQKRIQINKKSVDRVEIQSENAIGKIFWESNQFSLSFGGAIPPSVLKQVAQWKLENTIYSFTCDSTTKLACCIGNSICFVWDMLSNLNNWAPNAVQTLHLPYNSLLGDKETQNLPMLAALPEIGQLRHGLLVASPSGMLYYWDDIKLSQGKEAFQLQLDISPGDRVKFLLNALPAGFFLATTHGHLFSVQSTGALRENSLQATRLLQPPASTDVLSYFQRMTGHIDTAISLKTSLTLSKLFLLTEKTLQIHALGSAQAGHSVQSVLLQSFVQQIQSESPDWSFSKARIADIAPLSPGSVVALAVLPLRTGTFFANAAEKYQLVLLHIELEQLQCTRKLFLPLNCGTGGNVKVATADARGHGKVLVWTESEVLLGNMDSLKCEKLDLRGTSIAACSNGRKAAFFLLSIPRGVFSLSLLPTSITASAENWLEQELQQWILYGRDGWNPVKFNFELEAEANWNAAVNSTCQAILGSKWRSLSAVSIQERAKMLDFLVRNLDAIVPRASLADKSTRFSLLWDLSKLQGAVEWHDLAVQTSESGSILSRALALLAAADSAASFSSLELFFSRGPSFIELVAQQLPEVVKNADNKHVASFHANSFAIALVRAAVSCNESGAGHLDLVGQKPMIENWLYSFPVLSCLDGLFHQLTTNVLPVEPSDIPRTQLEHQTVELARVTLAIYAMKLEFLRQLRGLESKETLAFEALFAKRRLFLLRPLVKLNKISLCIELAEQFRDFQVLVELVANSEASVDQLNSYIAQFGKDFAQILFSYYIENRMYKRLLQAHPAYASYVAEFLQSQGPALAGLLWIQQLSQGQYDDARGVLEALALKADSVESRALYLALAKLSSVATDMHSSRTKYLTAFGLLNDGLAAFGVPADLGTANRALETLTKKPVSVFRLGPMSNAIKCALEETLKAGKPLLGFYEILQYASLAVDPVKALELFTHVGDFLEPTVYKWFLTGLWRRAYLSFNWSEAKAAFENPSTSAAFLKDVLPKTEAYKLIAAGKSLGAVLSPVESFSTDFSSDIEQFYKQFTLRFAGALEASEPIVENSSPEMSVKSAIALRTRARTKSYSDDEAMEGEANGHSNVPATPKVTKTINDNIHTPKVQATKVKDMATPKVEENLATPVSRRSKAKRSYVTRSARKAKIIRHEELSPLKCLEPVKKEKTLATPVHERISEAAVPLPPPSPVSSKVRHDDWNFQRVKLMEEIEGEDKLLQNYVDKSNLFSFFKMIFE